MSGNTSTDIDNFKEDQITNIIIFILYKITIISLYWLLLF